MVADDLSWRVERACFDAYPPRIVDQVGEWTVALSGGGSRRTNSASPRMAGVTLDPSTLAAIHARYLAAALPTIFRVTDLAPGTSSKLGAGGFAPSEGRSSTLLRSAGACRADAAGVIVAGAPNVAWLAARRCMAPGVEDPALVAARVAVPTAYAQRHVSGEVVAIGYAALSDGIAVIEAVATAAWARRRGHARAIVATLIGWATDAGAEHIALQVEATNHAARALYADMGFAIDLYGYHYRRSFRCPTPA